MEQALTREPSGRFQSAASFGASLKPFDPDPASSQNELGALVRYVQSAPSIESMSAVRDSAQAIRVACRDSGTTRAVAGATAPARDSEDAITQKRDNPGAPGKSAAPPKDAARGGSTRGDAHPTEDEFSRATGEYTPIPSFVETSQQSRLGPWPFARLVEAIATGQIGRGDKVDYMGRGLKPIEELEELARFLPARTITTSEVTGLGSPDFFDDVSTAGLLSVLLRVLESQETGVLFAEGGWEVDALARTPPYESTTSRGLDGAPRSHPGEGRSPVPPGAGLHLGDGRKELYFKSGKLHHVASNNATELLGEYLVRRQMISREELDFALAVLPRYGGRMGDTLISLGLVSAVDIFRAIREQGKDRLTNLFTWKKGSLTLYLNQPSPHVEFALDLDITTLMLAGLEAAQPNDAPLQMFRGRLDSMVGPSTTNRPRLRAIAWPPLVGHLFELTQEPATLRDVLALATRGGGSTADDVLRALQILLAGKLLAFY